MVGQVTADTPSESPETIPVILDTDIGSDVDDAVCLAYLLRQPRCEILGVTTVTGEPERRAMLADVVCRAAGREDVPIFSGAGTPLTIEQKQREAPQAEVLPDWPHREDFEPNEAVGFLRRTIRARPGEVSLLTIGPLTNIGLLFDTDPETARMLRQIVLMCGCYNDPSRTEWNASGDPHASAIVFRSRVPRATALGLDVTTRVWLPAEECRQRRLTT